MLRHHVFKRSTFIFSLVLVLILSLFVTPAVFAAARAAQIELPELTPEVLAGIAGAVLSLALAYIPGLNAGYAQLPEDVKKFVMLLLLLAASLGIMALSCAPVLGIVFVECSTGGLVQVIGVFIAALMANQTTHRILPEASAVRAAKAKG